MIHSNEFHRNTQKRTACHGVSVAHSLLLIGWKVMCSYKPPLTQASDWEARHITRHRGHLAFGHGFLSRGHVESWGCEHQRLSPVQGFQPPAQVTRSRSLFWPRCATLSRQAWDPEKPSSFGKGNGVVASRHFNIFHFFIPALCVEVFRGIPVSVFLSEWDILDLFSLDTES